jgi:hypothetical protein
LTGCLMIPGTGSNHSAAETEADRCGQREGLRDSCTSYFFDFG